MLKVQEMDVFVFTIIFVWHHPLVVLYVISHIQTLEVTVKETVSVINKWSTLQATVSIATIQTLILDMTVKEDVYAIKIISLILLITNVNSVHFLMKIHAPMATVLAFVNLALLLRMGSVVFVLKLILLLSLMVRMDVDVKMITPWTIIFVKLVLRF